MTDSMLERMRILRDDALEIAKDSLDHDPRMFRVLNDVAERIRNAMHLNGTGVASVVVSQPTLSLPETAMRSTAEISSSQIISIYTIYNGVNYQAQLDLSRISRGVKECVYFEGDWRTPSGAAMRFTTSNVNGWIFWRYKRDDGSEGRINEIKKG